MRIAQVRPAVSLAAGGFLVVSASSFGIVTAATSGDAGPSGSPALMRAAAVEAAQGQTTQARTSAVSGATQQQCEFVTPTPTPSQSSTSPSTSPTGTGTASPTNSATGTPTSSGSSLPSLTPSPTSSTPSPSTSGSTTGGTGTASPTQTSGIVSALVTGLTPSNTTEAASTAAFVSNHDGNAPVAATLLSVTRADAASPKTYLCVSVQRDETSVARGQTAQWNVNVWSQGGNVSNVKLTLAAAPTSLKPVFSFGCAKEGTNSCTFATVDSDARQLQAQVHIAKSATSVKTVKLTATGSGKGVSTKPKASEPITVTAPPASASASPSASASSSAATSSAAVPGAATTVPQPSGVTSQLGVGKLPFLNGSGSALNPGGNASSLFPKLNPSSGALPTVSGDSNSRTRQVAEALPADASVMGAQYAGLAALALAFVLSVTRLSIRRRHAAKPGSGNSN